jgi:predicted HNH restriction endonuclease
MNPNVYKKQCERALKRKLELIEYKGGKCEICGYDKNIATLDFHHINPDEKSFQLDSRHLSNTHIEKLLQEVNKCMLLCANCHREIHYPKFDKDNISNLLNECETKNIKINGRKQKYSICPFGYSREC